MLSFNQKIARAIISAFISHKSDGNKAIHPTFGEIDNWHAATRVKQAVSLHTNSSTTFPEENPKSVSCEILNIIGELYIDSTPLDSTFHLFHLGCDY